MLPDKSLTAIQELNTSHIVSRSVVWPPLVMHVVVQAGLSSVRATRCEIVLNFQVYSLQTGSGSTIRMVAAANHTKISGVWIPFHPILSSIGRNCYTDTVGKPRYGPAPKHGAQIWNFSSKTADRRINFYRVGYLRLYNEIWRAGFSGIRVMVI